MKLPSTIANNLITDLNLSEKEKLTKNKKIKINPDLAAIGIGASTFLIFNISNFIKENPQMIANTITGIVDHWDNITLTLDIIDTVGFSNIFETGVDVVSLAIHHTDLIWDVADLVGIGADISDAASTFGLSILLSGATSLVIHQVNKENESKLKELKNKTLEIEKLKKYLEYAQPPQKIIQQLKLTPQKNWEL